MKSTSLLAIAFTTFLSVGVFAQDYQIQIHRPMKVGEQYQVQVSGTQSESMTVTSNGNPVKDKREDFTVDYKSVEKVDEVDSIGRETKTTSTIEKLVKTEGGVAKELLPKGTVVVSSLSGRNQIHEVGGQPVDAETAKVLSLVISLGKGGPSDDAAFGTKDRKKAGESWEPNVPAIMEALGESFGGKMENVKSKGTLVAVTKDAGGDVLKLDVHVEGNAQPPLPPAFTIDEARFDAEFSGDFPVNLDLGRPKDVVTLSVSFSAHTDAPTGEKVVLKVKTNTSMVHSQTRV